MPKYEVHVQTSFIRSLVVETETKAEAIEITKKAFQLDEREAILEPETEVQILLARVGEIKFTDYWEFAEDPDTYVIGEVP